MIETPMTDGMNQRALEAINARIPLGRMGRPEEVWQAVRFIIECSYFTGSTIDVNGGFSF